MRLRTMTSRLLLPLSMCLLVKRTAAQTNDYNQNTVLCNTGQGTRAAYNSIESIQMDINTELSRLTDGNLPQLNFYEFVLCANTNFAVEEAAALTPLLNNININCGIPPTTSLNCVFTGNDIQVFLPNTDASPYPVERFIMSGVTFENFSRAAIAGRASPNTELLLINPRFQNFDSQHIIDQSLQNNNDPFRVRLIGQNAGGGSVPTILDGNVQQTAFPVENADLDMEFVLVQNLEVAGDFISASGNEATVGVRGTIMVDSNVDAVISLMQGADATVDQLTVADMEEIQRVVAAEGLGTEADIIGLQVINNENNPGDIALQYVEVIDGASANVTDSEFQGNNNVLYGFQATDNSQIFLDNIQATNNEGTLDVDDDESIQSSIVYASGNSTIEVVDSIFSTTDGITSVLFSTSGSDIQSRRVCISNMPAMESVVYSSFESTVSVREDSAIENSPPNGPPEASLCPDEELRLLQDTSTDSCILSPQNCTFDCENWAAFDECSLIPLRNETDAPTSAPTAPTGAPTTPLPTITPSTLAPGSTAFPTVTPSTAAPTSPTSDQPSKVPTGSPIPTRSPGPTTETRSPTGRPTFNPDPPPGSPTRAPSFFPSSIPTIVQTSTPTTTTRFPTVSPRPTTMSPTTGPTITPRPTSIPPTGRPTVTASPTISMAPSDSPTSSLAPTITPRPTTSRPSIADRSPAPTSCRVPPVRKERVLESGGWKYVYHYVYVEKSPEDDDSDLPFCPPSPAPTPPSKGAPYYTGKGFLSKGKGYVAKGKGYVAKGKGYEFLEKKSSKSNKSPKVRRNLEGKDDQRRRGLYDKKEDLFSGLQMWYQ